MKYFYSAALGIITVTFLSGCFDNLNPANKSSASSNKTSSITSAQFSGAASATNRIAGILITWPAVSDLSLVKAYRVYRGGGNSQILVASLAPSVTSFMDGTVEPGAIYTYLVKAVDQNNLEDGNTKTVKSLSWAGFSSVAGASRTSLQVNFANPAAVVDEIRVYGQLAIGGPKTLLATASGSDTSVSIEGLRTGYNYIISAQAYVASLGKEDGNDLTMTASTFTAGYDSDGSELPKWSNVMSVRAFGEAPGAPAHPITPEKSPNQRVVELTFNAFTGVGNSVKYVVTRVIDGFTMDSSVASSCTDTTFTSCRACDSLTASNGVIFCRDTAVAASPARYRYSLSMIQTDASTGDTWVEPLPTDQDVLAQFSVLVPIPPKNMVLVQRDAANYEMCLQLNKPSDPQNFNRCPYSGIGAAPYSSGNNKPPLNLSNAYYDFGYDLFVDRWEMGCNWTRAANGGMCGANHTSGDCINFGSSSGSIGAPQSTQGKVGDVFFWMTSGSSSGCYIATSQDSTGAITWMTPINVMTNIGTPTSTFQTMFTNDPGYIDSSNAYHSDLPGLRAKTTWANSAASANAVCSSQSDANYGQKRLSRAREYVAYSAPSILTAEPYTAGSYANFMNRFLKGNAVHNSSNYYGCEAGTVADTPPATLSQLLDYTNYPAFKEMTFIKGVDAAGNNTSFGGNGYSGAFMIGAVATVDCQSRYGVQDMMDTTITSDATYFNQSTYKSTGIMSPYDNGNKDFLSDLNGGTSGFVFDLSMFSSNYLVQSSPNLMAVIPPLGLPITTATYSSNYVPKGLITQPYTTQWGGPPSTYGAGVFSTRISNRWSFGIQYTITTGSAGAGVNRCALPAE